MKLVHLELDMQLFFEKRYVNEWIIESPEYFLKIVQELKNQSTGKEGRFVLSRGDKIVDFCKETEMVINPFGININDTKILKKLYEQIVKSAYDENNYLCTQKISQEIFSYLLQLENQSNYILDIDTELDLTILLKAAGVKVQENEDDFVDTIVKYMELVSEILNKKIVIFVNLRSYMNDEQIREFVKMALYKEIEILLIENQQRTCVENVRQYIIDKDQCEIF